MEKIKASEVLKGFKYLAIDKDGCKRVFSNMPSVDGFEFRVEGFDGRVDSVCTIGYACIDGDWKESLREIDFSEDFTEERLDLIDRITSYAAKKLSLRDYNRIVGFFEEIQKPDYVKGFSISEINHSEESQDLANERSGSMDFKFTDTFGILGDMDFSNNSNITPQGTLVFKDFDGKLRPMAELGQIVIPPTKEPNSIFKLDDTVHVLSYSNVGEFGKSTEGIIKTIYKDDTVLVKVDEGVEEVHKEDNVSFTPFSIKEAGFSQVRPVREPKIGDWGFFHDDKKPDWFIYGKLGAIKDISADCRYKHGNGSHWRYFSIEPPQLAEGVPNPFTKC